MVQIELPYPAPKQTIPRARRAGYERARRASDTPPRKASGVWEGKKSERYPTAEGERGMGGQEEQVIPCIK